MVWQDIVCAGEALRGYEDCQYVQKRSTEGEMGAVCAEEECSVYYEEQYVQKSLEELMGALCAGEECDSMLNVLFAEYESGVYEGGSMCRRV